MFAERGQKFLQIAEHQLRDVFNQRQREKREKQDAEKKRQVDLDSFRGPRFHSAYVPPFRVNRRGKRLMLNRAVDLYVAEWAVDDYKEQYFVKRVKDAAVTGERIWGDWNTVIDSLAD